MFEVVQPEQVSSYVLLRVTDLAAPLHRTPPFLLWIIRRHNTTEGIKHLLLRRFVRVFTDIPDVIEDLWLKLLMRVAAEK